MLNVYIYVMSAKGDVKYKNLLNLCRKIKSGLVISINNSLTEQLAFVGVNTQTLKQLIA